jgi:tetrahydromethanopterin S-methyltransferase subunit G
MSSQEQIEELKRKLDELEAISARFEFVLTEIMKLPPRRLPRSTKCTILPFLRE